MGINKNYKKYLDNYRVFSYTNFKLMLFIDRLTPRNHALFQILYWNFYVNVYHQQTPDE